MTPVIIVRRIRELGGDIHHAERYLEKYASNVKHGSMEALEAWIDKKLNPPSKGVGKNGFRIL